MTTASSAPRRPISLAQARNVFAAVCVALAGSLPMLVGQARRTQTASASATDNLAAKAFAARGLGGIIDVGG